MTRKAIFGIVIIFLKICLSSCNLIVTTEETPDKRLEFERKMDSIASSKIDSAYKAIQLQCDSARQYKIPFLVDSLLKDTTKHEK